MRLFAAACLLLLSQSALADLMINPTRVVFEKNQRSASVDLINDGTKPASYRVQLVNRRMSEDGQFVRVEQALPGEQFANSMIVFSPRQFTLAPGASQVVRIAVRKPAGLAPGEYRSHLSFDRLPDSDEASNIENINKSAPPGEIGVQITALIGVSIPVIVRHGNLSSELSISNIALIPPAAAGQPPMLGLQLNRTGTSSIYGDVVVNFTPTGGREAVIGRVSGLAVYVPNTLRRATINLQVPSGTSLAQGKISVVFQERADDGGKQLAEASIAVP